MVYTVEDSVLAVVSAAAFVAYLKRQPEVMLLLMRHFVSSIRQLNSRVVGLSSLTGVQRVYRELLQMAEPDPQGEVAGLFIRCRNTRISQFGRVQRRRRWPTPSVSC